MQTAANHIYRISENGILQRAQTFSTSKRNIMGIYDNGGLAGCDVDRLFRDILMELNRRNFNGVLFDIGENPLIFKNIEKLCSMLSHRRILHFIPVSLGFLSSEAKLIIPSTISGGAISDMINNGKNQIAQFAGKRVNTANEWITSFISQIDDNKI